MTVTCTSLMGDLEERVFGMLPDDTWFYPGHGDDATAPKARTWPNGARGW